MASFNDVLTENGRSLINKMLAGNCSITFTRMVCGDGTLSASQSPETMTDLVSPRSEGTIMTTHNGNIVGVSGNFSNKELSEGMYLREKGIYASDGTDEVLMIYANCGDEAEWIEPAIEGVVEKVMKSVMTFSQNDNVSITVSSEGYVARVDYDEDMEFVAFYGNGEAVEFPEIPTGDIHEATSTISGTVKYDDKTINKNEDGQLVVNIDGTTIKLDEDGKLCAEVSIDDETIKRNEDGQLYVNDVSEVEGTFKEAKERTNIESGEKISTIFGKIKKFLSDLKAVAFSGSYEDLDNKPSIPTVTNNDLATEAGTAWDAVRGAAIRAEVDTLKSNLIHTPMQYFNNISILSYALSIDTSENTITHVRILDAPDNPTGIAVSDFYYTIRKIRNTWGSGYYMQITAYDNRSTDVYIGSYIDDVWIGWEHLAKQSDITNSLNGCKIDFIDVGYDNPLTLTMNRGLIIAYLSSYASVTMVGGAGKYLLEILKVSDANYVSITNSGNQVTITNAYGSGASVRVMLIYR